MSAETEVLRVVVVDDHEIVRDGLIMLLGSLDGIDVVGSAADGREALAVVEELRPDVVVMDIQMPRLDGIEATRFLHGRVPESRVIVLTMNEDDDTILSAIKAGASGYLVKGSGAAEVERAVRVVGLGGMVYGASLAPRIAALVSGGKPQREVLFPELTDRERSVLELLASGRTNDEIAAELFLANKTVRNIASTVYAKLGVPGRVDAIVLARSAGMGG